MLISGAELAWSEGDMWNVVVELPAGSVVEYKYVVLDKGGMHAIAWQRGNNSVLAVSHEDTQVDVRSSPSTHIFMTQVCSVAS